MDVFFPQHKSECEMLFHAVCLAYKCDSSPVFVQVLRKPHAYEIQHVGKLMTFGPREVHLYNFSRQPVFSLVPVA